MANKRPITGVYSHLEKVSRSMGDNNQCGVIAISIVAGIPYEEALRLVMDRGRPLGKGTPTWVIHSVLEVLGFTMTAIPTSGFTKLYPGRHSNKRWVTTHHPTRFHSVWPKGIFLMYPRGHVLSVVDGVVHDWSVQNSLRVNSIYRVDRNA